MQPCPCGADADYAVCCGPFIDGSKLPETPEKLMRSRYTAYTQANIDYITKTMKGPAEDKFDADAAQSFAKRVEWQKLEVIETAGDDSKGFVEFLAHFRMKGQRHVIHERSEFHFENDRWYYYDGVPPPVSPAKANHIGRNDPCLCGSGKKYKK